MFISPASLHSYIHHCTIHFFWPQPDCKRQHQHVVLPVTQVPSLHNPVSPHQTQSKTSNAIIAVTTFIHHVIQNSTKLEQTILDPISPQCSLTAAGPHVMSASSQPAKQHFPSMHRHTGTLALCKLKQTLTLALPLPSHYHIAVDRCAWQVLTADGWAWLVCMIVSMWHK